MEQTFQVSMQDVHASAMFDYCYICQKSCIVGAVAFVLHHRGVCTMPARKQSMFLWQNQAPKNITRQPPCANTHMRWMEIVQDSEGTKSAKRRRRCGCRPAKGWTGIMCVQRCTAKHSQLCVTSCITLILSQ